MPLTFDQPENRGVMRGLKRAAQFTQLVYSPIRLFPICHVLFFRGEKSYCGSSQFAGWPAKGLPYSSVIKHQKFIGYHVSFESFMTALQDPNSVLYTKDLFDGERKNAAAWYGTVCSSLASYVWDLPIQHTCSNWAQMDDVECLGQPALEDLRLLDALLNATHIAVITGIERDEQGTVQRVEVSESTLPNCRVTWFTAEQFLSFWYRCPMTPYRVYRRRDHSGISYTPNPFVHVAADPRRGIEGDEPLPPYAYNRVIVPNQGNRANYLAGEEPVILDILDEAFVSVEIQDEQGNTSVFPVEDGRVCPGEQPCGRYAAVALDADRRRSDPAYYAVVNYAPPFPGGTFAPGEAMELQLAPLVEGDKPLYYSFSDLSDCNTALREVIPDAAAEAGRIVISAPNREGEYFLTLGTKNDFGIYSSGRFIFRVEKK